MTRCRILPGLHFSHCSEPLRACNGQHEPLEKRGKENSQLLCLLPTVLSIKFILLHLLARCSACVSFAMHLTGLHLVSSKLLDENRN